jgi:hypothetical protein
MFPADHSRGLPVFLMQGNEDKIHDQKLFCLPQSSLFVTIYMIYISAGLMAGKPHRGAMKREG